MCSASSSSTLQVICPTSTEGPHFQLRGSYGLYETFLKERRSTGAPRQITPMISAMQAFIGTEQRGQPKLRGMEEILPVVPKAWDQVWCICLGGTGHLESLASKLFAGSTEWKRCLQHIRHWPCYRNAFYPQCWCHCLFPNPPHIQVLMMTLEKAIQIPWRLSE